MTRLWSLARAHPLRVSFAGFAIAALVCGGLWDTDLALYFKHDADPELVALFAAFTGLGRPDPWFATLSFGVFLALTAWYLDFRPAIKERIGRVITASVFVFLSVAVSGLAVNVIKPLAGRHRPRDLFAEDMTGFDPLAFDLGLSSFPSGHAQMIFALAVALVLVAPRFDHVFMLFATAVAASRVVVGAHYLSDVILGAWIGIAAPVLLHRHFFRPRGLAVRVQTSYRHPGLLRQLRDGLDRLFAYTPPPQAPPESPPEFQEPDHER